MLGMFAFSEAPFSVDAVANENCLCGVKRTSYVVL